MGLDYIVLLAWSSCFVGVKVGGALEFLDMVIISGIWCSASLVH